MMINFQAIEQSIINTEYGCNPQSLVLLVPGISLIFQKIQASHLLTILRATYQNPNQPAAFLFSPECEKLDTIHKWHALGSLIQMVTLIALHILVHPIFLAPIAFPMYEMGYSIQGLIHQTTTLPGQLIIHR